jgi:glucose-6-phosphate 1-dehydrogenase
MRRDSTGDADILIIFGITGNLAKVMTFQALYRLEARSLLNCPVVGVAAERWSVDDLRNRAQESIEAAEGRLDRAVFERLASRMSYLGGDIADPDTYTRLADAVDSARVPVFYLEIPPSLFDPVVKGLAKADLIREGRIVIEKPFGHDFASARDLATEMHRYVEESQLYRIDHFLGKMGLEDVLFLRFANSVFESVWSRDDLSCIQITMAEKFGVEDRGHFYDPVGALRDVVVNHLLQLTAAATMEAPGGAEPQMIKSSQLALWRAIPSADPAKCVRGQYEGYRSIDGVASDSTTETYAALRLDIENWRWDGVPVFIRTGKRLPVTATELRLIFRDPPRRGMHLPAPDTLPPSEVVVRLNPSAGIQLSVNAHRGFTTGTSTLDLDTSSPLDLDLNLARQEATPYEVLLHAALTSNSTRFVRQDGVEEEWRIVQPLLDDPAPIRPYRPGTWGPAEADQLVAAYGGWRQPWIEP